MIRDENLSNDRFYEPEHIAAVLEDMKIYFPTFFDKFAPDKIHLAHHMKEGIERFENDRTHYLQLLDRTYLEECEYDPGSFRNILKTDCPIIRHCLNAPAKVMDAYRRSFRQAKGDSMLKVIINLSEYVTQFMKGFDANKQLNVKLPSELELSILDTDSYTTTGVIGGGIRSLFLYNAQPIAFPNRSQFSIWAYYFLTHQEDYGYEDGSEFLMINPDGSGTQQNYYYQYDLFTFYGIKLFLMVEAHCKRFDYPLHDQYRYVYLNTFLDFISVSHIEDINALKPINEQFEY